jgi:uncharacterized protein YgiM (DUF1202 family)
MPKHMLKLSPQALSVIVVFCFMAMMLALMLTTTVAAQGTQPEPTSEFNLNLPPTAAAPTETLNPQMLDSLTGVNGQAANADVNIRSGPGLSYRAIGGLRQGRWIDIVGWNGWEEGRVCSSAFEADLDMWVQVQFGERRGWIARCVLDIRGRLTDLPVVNASGERVLQR